MLIYQDCMCGVGGPQASQHIADLFNDVELSEIHMAYLFGNYYCCSLHDVLFLKIVQHFAVFLHNLIKIIKK